MTAADNIRVELSPDEIEAVRYALGSVVEAGALSDRRQNLTQRVLDKIGTAGEESGVVLNDDGTDQRWQDDPWSSCDHTGETVERTRTGYLNDDPRGEVETLCVDCGSEFPISDMSGQ